MFYMEYSIAMCSSYNKIQNYSYIRENKTKFFNQFLYYRYIPTKYAFFYIEIDGIILRKKNYVVENNFVISGKAL